MNVLKTNKKHRFDFPGSHIQAPFRKELLNITPL